VDSDKSKAYIIVGGWALAKSATVLMSDLLFHTPLKLCSICITREEDAGA